MSKIKICEIKDKVIDLRKQFDIKLNIVFLNTIKLTS